MYSYEQAEQIVNELGVRIYTGLRDGGLDAEPVVELARLPKEWDVPAPITRELLDRPHPWAEISRPLAITGRNRPKPEKRTAG